MKMLRNITLLAFGLVALSAAVLLGPAQSAQSRSAQSSRLTTTPCPSCTTPTATPTPSCTCTPTPAPTPSPNIPLNDLGNRIYSRDGDSARGGLYSNGSNQIPTNHYDAGVAIAASIMPLNGMCTPTPTPGKIGLLSIGMCNTWFEFGGGNQYPNDAFKKRAEGRVPGDPHPDKAKSDNVVVINGAQSGATADKWAQETNDVWTTAINKVTQAGLCREQVAVVWMEHAVEMTNSDAGFQESVQDLQNLLTAIVQNVLIKFPNCKMAFLSTRTRAFTTWFHNPEPYAYETGFANKFTIKSQIDGNPNLCFDNPLQTETCTVVAPYIAWGPYYWVDGSTPRSDGKTWECSDLKDDFVHPTGCGVHKVADQLLAFFETSPLTTLWYLRQSAGSNLTVNSVDYTECSGSPSYTVQFCADVSGGTGYLRYSWDFDDGDYDYDNPTPTKSFPAPPHGTTYNVRVTVVDEDGNHAQGTIAVTAP